ncbi:hypothetical protein KIW84_042995 [Lathyrus oleraceus]|uniref:Uncharacterized protein n=1 Tax=Pisum sativum TaxID=3888 RepID=A0A9D4XE08_PEA|nr:hypothetical protein KIW84_042995 [Pisum sativum]
MTLICDNQVPLHIASNPGFMRGLNIVREKIESGDIVTSFVNSNDQLACVYKIPTRDAFDHAQQAARVFKNRSSLRSTLLEAPSIPQPNYEWMSVIDSRACWNIGNGQRVKMLGDNWFLGQAEFEV